MYFPSNITKRTVSNIVCISFLILHFSMGVTSAYANEETQSEISVGFINVDWFPFSFIKDEQVAGFAIDVATVVLEQQRRKVDFQSKQFSQALESLKSGELDAFFGLGKNLDRIDQFHFSRDPLYVDETVLIGQTDDPFIYNGDVSSLIGKRIGIIKGAIHGPAFDNMTGIIRVPHDSGIVRTAQFFNDILTDKYDFLAVNSRVGAEHFLIKLNLQDQLKIYEEPIAIKNYYLVFSNKLNDLENITNRFNRIHRLFQSTNEYKSLLDKYNLSPKLFPR